MNKCKLMILLKIVKRI